MFDEKILNRVVTELVAYSANKDSAILLIEKVILPTIGSEGDIIFWNKVKEKINEQ